MLTPVEGQKNIYIDQDGHYYQRLPLGDGMYETVMVTKEWVYGEAEATP